MTVIRPAGNYILSSGMNASPEDSITLLAKHMQVDYANQIGLKIHGVLITRRTIF